MGKFSTKSKKMDKGPLRLSKVNTSKITNTVSNTNETNEFFIRCIRTDNVPDAEYLMKNGVNIDIVDAYGYTALMISANYNHVTMAKLLIKYGANLNSVDKYGLTALMRCACYNHFEIAEFLLRNGAIIDNIRTNDGRTTIDCAHRNENYYIEELVLQELERRNKAQKNFQITIKEAARQAIIRIFMKCNNKLGNDERNHICKFL